MKKALHHIHANKKHAPLFLAAVFLLAFAIFGFGRIGLVRQVIRQREGSSLSRSASAGSSFVADDYRNGTYVIDGKKITLTNGKSESPVAPGSATMSITRYFGNNLSVDLNNDGKKDEVFYLTHTTGGTGTFFYVVAALAEDKGYTGSLGYFVGDRIAPQTINQDKSGTLLINYADRKAGEDFSVQPSEGKTIRLIFDNTLNGFGLLR